MGQASKSLTTVCTAESPHTDPPVRSLCPGDTSTGTVSMNYPPQSGHAFGLSCAGCNEYGNIRLQSGEPTQPRLVVSA